MGVGFSHQHVLPRYANIGLFSDPELSNFPYPDRRYCSSVLWADAVGLTGVLPENQAMILWAREVFATGNKLPVRLELVAPRLSRTPPPRISIAPVAPSSSTVPPRPSLAPQAVAAPHSSALPQPSHIPRTTIPPRDAVASLRPRAAPSA